MTKVKLFYQLSTNSKKALLKTTTKWGHPYKYRPKGTLLKRLAAQNGMTKEQVLNQLIKERKLLLSDL